MTIRTEPAVQDHLGDAPSPARWRPDAAQSMRRASLTAGIGTLLMIPLAVFGNFVAVQGLMTQGDAEKTARGILASEGIFRLGIVSLFLVIVLDVVVAWALFRVFSPVSTSISMLAAWFRIVFAGVFLVAVGELVGVLRLLGNQPHLAVFDARQLHSMALLRINAFTDVWNAGLVLFSFSLLTLGPFEAGGATDVNDRAAQPTSGTVLAVSIVTAAIQEHTGNWRAGHTGMPQPTAVLE
jgi:Domain of unknown function (DUF4386)